MVAVVVVVVVVAVVVLVVVVVVVVEAAVFQVNGRHWRHILMAHTTARPGGQTGTTGPLLSLHDAGLDNVRQLGQNNYQVTVGISSSFERGGNLRFLVTAHGTSPSNAKGEASLEAMWIRKTLQGTLCYIYSYVHQLITTIPVSTIKVIGWVYI